LAGRYGRDVISRRGSKILINASDDLIRVIFNGFSISLMRFSKPPECSKNIKVFLENVLQAKPSWKGIDLKSYQSILDDPDALEIIKLVQDKINAKGIFSEGGRRSFKKRTKSAKRKSIKRSRSNRRRHRRTTRK
jgi:hypothetical protein